MKRGFSKKAQEGMSAGALGAIVLVIIVVVLLILVLSGVMNPILSALGLLPGSGISAVVTACESYVPLSSTADYCSFKEVKVDGRTQYVNCEDSRVKALMKTDVRDVLTCSSLTDPVVRQCAVLVSQAKSKPFVNEQECSTKAYVCEGEAANSLRGNAAPSDGNCGTGKRKITQSSVSGLDKDCCVTTV